VNAVAKPTAPRQNARMAKPDTPRVFGPARPLPPRREQPGFFTSTPGWGRPISVLLVLTLLAAVGAANVFVGPYVSMRGIYDLPVVLAVVWLGLGAGLFTAALCVAIFFGVGWLGQAEYARAPLVLWNAAASLLSHVFVALALNAFVRLRRELEQRVRLRTAALERESQTRAELQRELLLASGRERSAIGQDLHDGLCQHLVGTALAAQVLAGRLGARQAPEQDEAGKVVRLIEEGIAQTRHLARGLLLASIRPERLVAELEEFAVNISRQSGIPCRFQTQGTPAARDEQTASHLFRIAEEAVRNALRHARPRRVEITLAADAAGLTLTVVDMGEGLPPTGKSGAGVGQRIMGHRAKIIGGELAIEHLPGRGTSIRCHVPAV
jgi:signal transduction histidine kinase